MWHYGHIHEKKVDDSRMIYPGSLVSCGFDEPGKHGFIFGEITKEDCKLEFIPSHCKEYKNVEIDISTATNYAEVIDKIECDDSFYKFTFYGSRNFDMAELIEALKALHLNICEIKDDTVLPYDFDGIMKQETLKGIFTKKMFEEMERMNSDEKNEALKMIECVYQMMD